MQIIKIKLIRSFLALLLVSGLTACGGGGHDHPNVGGRDMTGFFIDSPVSGLEYQSYSHSGLTNSSGAYVYDSGENISFYIGDILIGSARGERIITPVSLINSAVDENDPTVTNIVRFLLTIDDSPSNPDRIVITQDIRDAATDINIDFSQSTSNFENDPDVLAAVDTLTTASTPGTRTLVSIATARNHLATTLHFEMAGSYSGTYSGGFFDDSGSWNMTVYTDGYVGGYGYSDKYLDSFTISGYVDSSGELIVTGNSFAVSRLFDGFIDIAKGDMYGNWEINLFDYGDFSGHKH